MAIMILMALVAVSEAMVIGSLVPFLSAVLGSAALPEVDTEHVRLMDWLRSYHGVEFAFMVLFSAIVLTAVLRLSLAFWGYRFTYALGVDMGSRIIQATLERPYHWHLRHNSGETLAAVVKVDSAMHVFNQALQAASALVVASAIVVALFFINATIFIWLTASLITCYACITLLTRMKLSANATEIARALDSRLKTIQEALGGIREVILDGSSRHFNEFFNVQDARMRRAEASNAFMAAAPRLLIESIGLMAFVALGLFFHSTGSLGTLLPTLGGFILGLQRLLPQVQSLYLAWSTSEGSRVALSDIISLLEVTQDTNVAPNPIAGARGSGIADDAAALVELRKVGFRYSTNQSWVIRGLSLEVRVGERLGVVGHSGAGKTTLVDLILGLLRPQEGLVFARGKVLDPASTRDWMGRVAHVPQTVYLADLSVAENVAFGCSLDQIDENRVLDALKGAAIDKYVTSMAKGIWTRVGERGLRLSAGQRQRIGIARALYKNIELLVLDEATSALDLDAEAKVLDTISDLGSELTVIVVSHRTSSLRDCDRIIDLDTDLHP